MEATLEGASHFDVLILGPFALFRDGVLIDAGTWQHKVQTLLRLLITSSGMRRTREEAIDILWPEAPGEAGARNLRVVLHMLRRGLGGGEPNPVLSDRGMIALNPAHEWDLDLLRFEEVARAAADSIAGLEQAAGYYRGEPLDEDRYEDWAIAVRGRAQRTWRAVCLRLADLHRRVGSPEVAVTWLDRVLAADPLDEEALCRLLSGLGQMERRTEALRRYAHFAERLKDELGGTPSRETLAIVGELRAGYEERSAAGDETAVDRSLRPVPVIPRYSLPRTGKMVGRERELGRILWTLPPMHLVAPRLVAVAAPAGGGKTRLLAEVAARARTAGVTTLAGGCYRHEGALPYGPIRDALSDWIEAQPEGVVRGLLAHLLSELLPLVPEIRLRFGDVEGPGVSSAGDVRLRAFVAMRGALERIAGAMPVVLLLDDMHLAEPLTLQMLHFIVRQSQQNRMLVVAAYTQDEEGDAPPIAALVGDMEAAGWASSLTLGLLSCQDLGQLLQERVGGKCAPNLIEHLYIRSGGNPLDALAAFRGLQGEDRLQHLSGDGWSTLTSVG